MYDEDDLLPLSGVQHYVYCARRAALVYIEGVWAENRFTAEGREAHERVHQPSRESRGDVRTVRSLLVRSLCLGLSGKLDVVEFHRIRDESELPYGSTDRPCRAIPLPDTSGLWHPFPVEYKRGRSRHEESYEVQLCAQAMCLEEMMGVAVPVGAIYFGSTGRRLDIDLDDGLRRRTLGVAVGFHDLVRSAVTPPASPGKKCPKCSLLPLCMPAAGRRSATRYIRGVIRQAGEGGV